MEILITLALIAFGAFMIYLTKGKSNKPESDDQEKKAGKG